jgi:hypothetical protein
MLAKRPGFTLTAVIVLALGIGANTALFSVVHNVLFSPLPFIDAGRLVLVQTAWRPSGGGGSCSGPDFIDWAERNKVMEGLCAFNVCQLSLTGAGEPLALQGFRTTANFFDVLQPNKMALGRGFRSEESQTGNHYVAVLSHNLWRDRFDSDPNIVGKTITLDGAPHTVVGVAGSLMGFIEDMVRIYVPLQREELIKGHRGSHYLNVLGRVKPGISFAQAQAQMDQVALQIEKENPNTNVNKGIRIDPLHEILIDSVRTAFIILYGAVTVLLLVACVNVSNLLIAKASARSREIAIRQALGAGRGRLIRQLLTESILLGIFGGILGLVLAFWSLDMLQLIAPRIQQTGGGGIPGFEEIRVNLSVLGFTIGLSLIAGLLFGMVPAWQGSHHGLSNTLKETGQSVSRGRTRHRTLGTLVVAQIALAMILLTAAGLLIKSFIKLQRSHPGFNADRLLALHVVRPDTPENRNQQKRVDYFNRVIEKLAALPGVEMAGAIDLDPAKVHDVTLEIHSEEPSRRGIWGPFDEGGMEAEIAKPKYRGKWIRASHLLIRGELVEGKTLRVVRDVDFENLPDGPPKWETGLINNTWTGDKSTISVVPTGTEFGKALEVDVSNFAQISLGGPYNIEAGKTMRLSGTISARPPVQYTLFLRRGEECFRVDGSAMEQWKRLNFVVKTAKSCPDAYLHLCVFGVGKVWIGNLRLEEFDGVMPVQPPPRLGNLLQNSSFELGMDGTWYRDNSVFVCEGPRNPGRPVIDDTIAASGHRALRLEGHGMYSSSYYPVAYQQRCTLSFSARADYEGAGVYAEFIGPKAIGRGVRVPKDRWERIVLPFQIQDPEGQVLEVPAASVRIGENIPAGKHVWIDDLDLRHGEPAPYQPSSRREIALTTDKAHNRVDAGREFTVQVRAAVWGTASDVPADGLPVHLLLQDEMDTVIQEWDTLLRIEQGGQQENSAAHFINLTGQVTLPQGLPSGYWRFVTRSGLDASCEGEALVSVTPRLPAETPLDWPAGNHTGPDEIDSSFGTRWVRLHDCSIATRWWRVEPAKGKWTFDASDAEIAAYRKAGFRVLGLLEGVPGWRTKTGKFGHSALEYPDRDFTDWKNYVRTMVAHYKGVIDAWEVTNEPVFAGKSFDGQENPLWYTEILKQAYQAAKEVDPKVVIVGAAGGGHVEKNDKWTAATIGAGLFSYCDVFSYHGYGRTGTILLSTTDDYFAYVDWLHEEMQKRVGRILPIWDTENGYGPRSNTRKYWLPNHEGFAPLDMARTVAVAFACERFKGVEKTFYYHGWHYRLTEPAVLMNFHDVNSQLTPLTVTLPVAIQQLYGLQPGTASRQGLATVLQFASPAAEEQRRSVWMVWTERTPQPVEIRVPARAKVSAVQVFGRPFAVQVDGDKAAFQAGPWPVYVTAQ